MLAFSRFHFQKKASLNHCSFSLLNGIAMIFRYTLTQNKMRVQAQKPLAVNLQGLIGLFGLWVQQVRGLRFGCRQNGSFEVANIRAWMEHPNK
jgi:hypothetical protein